MPFMDMYEANRVQRGDFPAEWLSEWVKYIGVEYSIEQAGPI